ncbi:glycosyltransferase [Methanoculleus sp. 10]|uniref:glycosyltransferase family 4 protein n=1 Tax=Methanoculleus sp. 10 TaxID=430615 RepID=UPI0025E00CCD|nr:glycosyltransferase [Methanoculleus sp. 10]
MEEIDLCGVSVVSFFAGTAFSVPISNLSDILSATSETYVIVGAYEHIHFQKSNDLVHIYTVPYQSGASIIRQAFRYSMLQLKIIIRLFSLRKKFWSVVFFMESPPLLPITAAKIFNNNVYWLLPSKISLLSEDIPSKLTTILSEICYNLCNGIILYSPSLVPYWNLEPYRHKILIAHEHFLDFKIFTVTTPLPDRPLLIGYIGRLSEEKGVQHFAQALPAILGYRQGLRVLIGGDGQLKETIAISLQEEGLTPCVDLPGWISHDDLPNYLNQLRLLILPSYTEGLPNIMLEAMACGTPVLATPVGAIPDVIIDGKTGFIMENNTSECIAKNVIRVLNSPDLEQIAEDGRRFVEEHFTFEKTAENWKRILQRNR